MKKVASCVTGVGFIFTCVGCVAVFTVWWSHCHVVFISNILVWRDFKWNSSLVYDSPHPSAVQFQVHEPMMHAIQSWHCHTVFSKPDNSEEHGRNPYERSGTPIRPRRSISEWLKAYSFGSSPRIQAEMG